MVPPDVLRYLLTELRGGRLILFTGAGFSAGGRDPAGEEIPLSEALAAELFEVCFPGEERDDSTLQDLYQHALRADPGRLDQLLRRRLTVDPTSLPAYYRRWFAMPWRRIYTLNVDDIENAAARRFDLPRRIVSVSALTDDGRAHSPHGRSDELDVVHLNGYVADGAHGVTFSTTQYAERLAGRCRWYTQLVEDLAAWPFVIVGTKLDESPLWQHAQLGALAHDGARHRRPRSFLVTTHVTRARRSLLEDYNIEWLPLTTEAFAEEVLAQAERAADEGLASLDGDAGEAPPAARGP